MQNKGFTIIELVVVIAIIAILAAIVMVNVTQYINKAKNTAAMSEISQMRSAALNYYQDHNYSFVGMDTDVTSDWYKLRVAIGNVLGSSNPSTTGATNIAASDWCFTQYINACGGTSSCYFCADGRGKSRLYKDESAGCPTNNYCN
ncbi:MAG: prepilin-type N-terminal cleavage/methylation domain-containing protein [Candidatus Staskawiczbacteria bacterium]|nr:prepilin-type N-terminal cleavage/methylation domain-containing protein [Candidatus Staskawiczbacteria bacterium]